MKLGISLEADGVEVPDAVDTLRIAEDLGFDSVWVGEAYGSDAASALGYLGATTRRLRIGSAIMQMHGRTPAMTAMTAMTLDRLSGGRFILGLGVSGPQVVEGWHGVPYGSPLTTTKEYLDIVRQVIARESPVTYEGRRYTLPFDGDGATGLGRALRSSIDPLRQRIPIYLATLGSKSVELTGEIADGWLPIFYSPTQEDALCGALDRGIARRPSNAGSLEIVASPQIAMGPDIDDCRDRLRPMLALYIGGMGARGKNFYFDLVSSLGYESDAVSIQDAFLEGRKAEAASLVPDRLIDEVALAGPPERIAEQLEVWKASRVDTLCVRTRDVRVLAALAALI